MDSRINRLITVGVLLANLSGCSWCTPPMTLPMEQPIIENHRDDGRLLFM